MQGKGKKAKIRLAQMLADVTGMPPESLTDMPVLYIKGRCEMMVDGCRGVLEYTSCRICLKMEEEILTVTGENLTMSDFRRDSMLVRGQFGTVSWETEDRHV